MKRKKSPTRRNYFRVLAFASLMLAISLACNAVSGESATATIVPTSPPQPTLPPEPSNTLPPPTQEQAATLPPEATSPPDGGTSQLSDNLSTGSEGAFEFYSPVGWDVTAEDEASLWLEPPDFTGAIYLETTNTDISLDAAAFERFIMAREEADFSPFDNYSQDYTYFDDGFAVVEKTLDYEGVPQKIATYYEQYDNVIYLQDFWADEDLAGEYQEVFDEFYLNAFVDTDVASGLEPYLFVYDFYGPSDLFYIQVPSGWAYEQEIGEFATVDTFFAPDEHGVIQNITYDDGLEISKPEAGDFALELLREYYAADIKITDDEVQPDGSERLTWNSPGGEYSGISFFETRGTTFLLFTIMWDNAFEDVYFPIMEYTVNTYDVP